MNGWEEAGKPGVCLSTAGGCSGEVGAVGLQGEVEVNA